MTAIEIAILVVVCAGSIGSMIILINATDFPSTTETLKERQIQAELKAHSDEICRLAFRLRRIEDKLGIKEGEE